MRAPVHATATRRSIPDAKRMTYRVIDLFADASNLGYETIGEIPIELRQELQRYVAALYSDLARMNELELKEVLSDCGAEKLFRENEERAVELSKRPRWSDRNPSLKQTPGDFFYQHYSDWHELGLSWAELRQLDYPLYNILMVQQSRGKIDRIPLPNRTKTVVDVLKGISLPDSSTPLASLAAAFRALARTDRKRTSVSIPTSDL